MDPESRVMEKKEAGPGAPANKLIHIEEESKEVVNALVSMIWLGNFVF